VVIAIIDILIALLLPAVQAGCHFAMADESVHSSSENIDLATYRQLGKRDDGLPVGGYIE